MRPAPFVRHPARPIRHPALDPPMTVGEDAVITRTKPA